MGSKLAKTTEFKKEVDNVDISSRPSFCRELCGI